MVQPVLSKRLLSRVSFTDLLRMEDAYSSHPTTTKRSNWTKKTSQEQLFQQIYRLFPDEGLKIRTIQFFTFI